MMTGFLAGILIYAILILAGRLASAYLCEPQPQTTLGGAIICLGFGCAGALIGA